MFFQDLVSALRLKHTVDPVVCQLTACDYIVSNRMGVERKNISGLLVFFTCSTYIIDSKY